MFHVGDVIRMLRRERHMTQGKLASAANMRPNTLSDLERDPAKARIETLERVARALGTSVADLYSRLDDMRDARKDTHPDESMGRYNPAHSSLHIMLEEMLCRDTELARYITAIIVSLHATCFNSSASHGIGESNYTRLHGRPRITVIDAAKK